MTLRYSRVMARQVMHHGELWRLSSTLAVVQALRLTDSSSSSWASRQGCGRQAAARRLPRPLPPTYPYRRQRRASARRAQARSPIQIPHRGLCRGPRYHFMRLAAAPCSCGYSRILPPPPYKLAFDPTARSSAVSTAPCLLEPDFTLVCLNGNRAYVALNLLPCPRHVPGREYFFEAVDGFNSP